MHETVHNLTAIHTYAFIIYVRYTVKEPIHHKDNRLTTDNRQLK